MEVPGRFKTSRNNGWDENESGKWKIYGDSNWNEGQSEQVNRQDRKFRRLLSKGWKVVGRIEPDEQTELDDNEGVVGEEDEKDTDLVIEQSVKDNTDEPEEEPLDSKGETGEEEKKGTNLVLEEAEPGGGLIHGGDHARDRRAEIRQFQAQLAQRIQHLHRACDHRCDL